MTWILSNLRLLAIAAGICVVSSAVSFGVGYFKGKNTCAIEGQLQTAAIMIDKGEKNAEILANRPDADALIERVWPSGAY